MACTQEVVTWKGQLFFEDKPEPEPPALPGSLVAFSLNGALQGVAYRRAPHQLPFRPRNASASPHRDLPAQRLFVLYAR